MLIDPQTKKATQYINAKVVSDVDYKGKLTKKGLKELGKDPSVQTIADHYQEITDVLMIDNKDLNNISKINSMSVETDSIYMGDNVKKISLAKRCLELLEGMSV